MIEGERVVLDDVRSEDSDTLFYWINQPELVRLHGPFQPVERSQHDAWMARIGSDPATRVFAIRTLAERRLIGLLQLTGIHAAYRSAELRIRIAAPADRGQGLGSEATRLAVVFAFGALDLDRVWLNVFSDNAPAIAAYEKCGFTVEGLQRRAARIDGAWKDVVMMARLRTPANDFTEAGFAAMLGQLIDGGYAFAGYGSSPEGRHVIWRHDVDVSLHRAARLAKIEQARSVTATYFINPRCEFYNVFDAENAALIGAIAGAGHAIGLHFDVAAPGGGDWSAHALAAALSQEKALLESVLEAPVTAVSWHNPTLSNLLAFEADEIAGLANAYARRLRDDYVYTSDSNGYWRHTPMPEVIAAGHPRLHLLTHPEWWTTEVMSVQARFDRAVFGRAWRLRQKQQAMLTRAGRQQPD